MAEEFDLTWPEVVQAAFVAFQRWLQNIRKKRDEAYGASHELGGFDEHFAGCLGEITVAKHKNVFWSGAVGNLRANDVGPLQVRACKKAHHCLMLHPEDPDNKTFVLAQASVEMLPRVRLWGWLLARDGKLQQYWKDPLGNRPAFFVPIAKLHPISRLRLDTGHNGRGGA